MKKLLVLLFLTFSTLINAQEYKSFEVINVSESEVWPAVYKTMQALKLPKAIVNKNTGIGETGYYNYTALMIKNRCRFRFEYLDGDLTVSIFGRQYMSDNGWADNMLPMSKKQAANLLDPIEKQLSALSNTAADSPAQAVETSTPGQETSVSNTKITGIYDDFGIIKTENPDMELMAINNNGNIIGYSLWENKEKVKAVVCKENNDSEAIILEFDENGLPSYMKIQNLVIRINASSSGKLNLFIKDSAGNYIGEQQVAINAVPIQTSIDGFMENNTNHGPHYEPELMTPDLSVSDWLGYSSSALSQIANGLEKNVVSLVAIEFAKSLGVTLADPEKNFFLNEISTCVPIVVTAITPFVQAALGLTVTAASISTVAAVGVIAGGLKISWDAAMRIKERHWPSVEIIVSGNTDVRTGAFGEFGREYQLYARSNYPDEIIWYNDSYELEINKIELGDEYYIHADDNGRYFGIKVKAKELLDKTSYPVLQAIQIVNGKKFTKEIKLELINPTYYFINDCSNCKDDISNQN